MNVLLEDIKDATKFIIEFTSTSNNNLKPKTNNSQNITINVGIPYWSNQINIYGKNSNSLSKHYLNDVKKRVPLNNLSFVPAFYERLYLSNRIVTCVMLPDCLVN